ncbi:alpha/beta hydrolase fold domain-containing protein [Streptobacillus moniliformis]|uniref:alpha/beta hydrolase fold domain-containing protein n=1 Tax=Streptobacillus moniliformis TaxID=34105 RepID=UPI0007E4155E|nr:alpha/beta hydrolase [Streptobacillus moniliformis]
MKQIFKLIIMIVMFLMLGLFLLSKLYYKRSMLATVAEIYLKITEYKKISYEEAEMLLKEKKEMKEDEYRLPKGYEDIEIREYMGMKVMYLNERGKGVKLLYLHGGSYVHEPDPNHLRFLNKLIKETDISVILPVYPKAPKHNFKEAYDKVIGLYKEVSKDSDVVLMGDSAGGGFILGLAQEIKRLNMKEPKKLIAISPWVDLTMENPDILTYEKADPWLKHSKLLAAAKYWADGENLKDPRLSPIYGNLNTLENLIIFMGTRDILYPDVMLLADKMKKDNVKFNFVVKENLIHDYVLFPIPEAQEAMEMIVKIILN